MTRFVVPRGRTDPGRTAAPLVEAPETGADIAQFGAQLHQIGEVLENDYLTREAQRFQTDLTGDMNDLRLQAAAIGDPDQAERFWQERTAQLREAYLSQPGDNGLPRVHEKNRERFGNAFDRLNNQNAFSLGRQTLGARQAQHEANYIRYTDVATRAGATADPEVRSEILANGDAMIAELVSAGVIDQAEAERRRQGLQSDVDSARAIRMVNENPAGFITALEAGEFGGLPADTQERYRASANGALQAAAKAAAKDAERAERERQKQIGERLGEIQGIAEAGRAAVDEEYLADPDVKAHPDFGETMAAVSLRDEGVKLSQMSVDEIDALIADEKGRSLAHEFQTERLTVLQQARDDHAEGYAKDPIAYAAEKGFDVPEADGLDVADPAAFGAGLRARVVFANQQRLEGHTDTLRYLSNDEREALKAAAGVEASPTDRAALARELAVSLSGADPEIVESYELDDTFLHVGELQAQGASPQLAAEIFRGQQILDAGNVVIPPRRDRLDAANDTLNGLFANLDEGAAVEAQVRAAADALYSARVKQSDPTADIDDRVYRQALHEVMGGSGGYRDRDARGGVQSLRGLQTVLPSGVRSVDVEGALSGIGRIDIEAGTRRRDQAAIKDRSEAARLSTFRDISGGQVPTLGGVPLDNEAMDQVSVMAVGDDEYVMVFVTDAGLQKVQAEDGSDYTFSMRRLLSGATP